MKAILLGAILMVALVTVPAHAEILQLEPILDKYAFGSAITINGQSTSESVTVQLSDDDWNVVDIAELQAKGQFIGSFIISPTTWHTGIYTVLVKDGNYTITNTFQVFEGKVGKTHLQYWPDDRVGVAPEISAPVDIVIIPSNQTSIPSNQTEVVTNSTNNDVPQIDNPIPLNVTEPQADNSTNVSNYTKQLEIENAQLKQQVADLKSIILEQLRVITKYILGY